MLEFVVIVIAVILALHAGQHVRYLRIRRDSAQDRQNPLHSINAFHVLVFFKLNKGDKVIDTLRHFNQTVLSTGSGKLIYAGQAAYVMESRQLESCEWDGVILLEYPSRLSYQEQAAEYLSSTATRLFSNSYIHGMRRNRSFSLSIPGRLLRQRIGQLLKGRWRSPLHEPDPDFLTAPALEVWRKRAQRLRALHKINRTGLVTCNLIKHGTHEQLMDDDRYGQQMLSRMSEPAHGPLHIGRSIALEGRARFDAVYFVHYPSAAYFADLVSSRFFHRIVSNKNPGDTLAMPTAPITDRL